MGGCARPILSKPNIRCVDALGLGVLRDQQFEQLDAELVQHGISLGTATILACSLDDKRRSSRCSAGVRVFH